VTTDGFGARFPNGAVSHCFALNGSADAVSPQAIYRRAVMPFCL
jgi:hypothetical protein